MPRLIVTAAAVRGLERCRTFFAEHDPHLADKASAAITRRFAMLEDNANIGRPRPDEPELRELIISFGRSGYVALYRSDPAADLVYILAFRHQKEAGYGTSDTEPT